MALPKFSSTSTLSIVAVVLLISGLVIAVLGAQQQQDQRSKAAEPTTVVIADSVADFSGTQKQKGWQYGYTNGGYTGTGDFQEMKQFKLNIWFVEDGKYWTNIRPEIMGPNGNITSAGRSQWEQTAVRRWVSNYAGPIKIVGTVWDFQPADPKTGADGFGQNVRVDGQQLYGHWINEGDTKHYTFAIDATVHVGSVVDFIVFPGTNDWTDNVYFTAKISKPVVAISAPTVKTEVTCIPSGYTGSGVTISWTDTGIKVVDISSSEGFTSGTFFNKTVTGSSTTAPEGFKLHEGTTPLTLNPTTTYYVRTYTGTTYSPTKTFSLPVCVVVDTTPPSAPTNLQATPVSTSQINLTWTAATDNVGVTCYKIFRDGTEIAQATTTTYQNTGLAEDTLYKYQVSACDAAGNNSTKSNEAQAKTHKTVGLITKLNLDLLLHGIGKAGDSANPGESGGGNTSLVHFQRPITVQIVNAQNEVKTADGLVLYNAQSGSFKGTIDLDGEDFEAFESGVYAVNVKFTQSLNTLVPPGFQIITKGVVNTIPQFSLVTGDINNDNMLNIVDYDILIGCYSDLAPAVDCNPTKKLMADIDDDGNVHHTDLNLFLRELSVQGGQALP